MTAQAAAIRSLAVDAQTARVVSAPTARGVDALLLARRGRAGLLLAYGWRPFALAGQTGRAVAAWRRAAHATRRGRS